jgi:hypothetical protein
MMHVFLGAIIGFIIGVIATWSIVEIFTGGQDQG